ncbi:MAG: glycosyltransferase family 1 protein [Patescibacteria group bacterium]
MKIGFQGRFLDLPFTGIGQYSAALVREFGTMFSASSLRHELCICKPESSVAGKGFQRHVFEQHTAPKFFTKSSVDLIHFPYSAHPWRVMKVPTVVTVHDVIPWIFSNYSNGILSHMAHVFSKRSVHYASRIVTVSEFSKNEIMRVVGIPEEKISVIHNGCNEIFFDRSSECPAGEECFERECERPYMLYVGGYDTRKRVARLEEAFELFLKECPDALLVLVGKTHMANDEKKLACLYRHARMFVHFSEYEGFNIPVLEACASGTPVVISDIPVHRELFGEAAMFVQPDDLAATVSKMVSLWKQPASLASFGEKSRRVATQFSWKKCAEEHLKVYESFPQSYILHPQSSP